MAGFAIASSHCRGARDAGGVRDHAAMSTLDPSAAPARRVVSLVPSATEMLFALGAGERVVGVSAFDDYPPAVTGLPRIGGMVNPSFEAIVALRPDAVVGVQGPLDVAVLERLERMGVRVFFPRVESVREVLASCDAFGALVGRREAGAALRRSLEGDLARVRAAVASRPRARVLAVFGERPLSVAGPGSWVDEILSIAGGENVVRAGGRYPTISVEQVITLAPDVILDMTWGDSTLTATLSRYATVPAVRDGRVIRAGDPMLMRPGPRLGQAVVRIAAMLHPDARP
jgi:iron complex transport system substrate-binding protein